jgi:hypothetical protein
VRYGGSDPAIRRSAPRPPQPHRLHRLRDAIATIPLLLIVPALLLPFLPARAAVGGSLIASPQELAVLPTSGSAWTYLKGIADADLGIPNLTDQDNKHDVRTLAAALVANRLDSDAYRTKVRIAILGAMGTERIGADNSILALGRQLGAYVMAADLIGLSGADAATFKTWLSAIRTRELGGHGRYTSLKGTCEDSPHNWGTFACASLLAANRYVGDDAAVARSWAVFRGLTGDRSAYAGFQDMASDVWACPGAAFTPANSGCPGDAVRYGAFVKDVTRGSDPPTANGSGLSYTLEILQGVALQAELLTRAGYGDAWNRLRPAFDWARRNGALDLSSVGYHVTWWANKRLGWSLATRPAAMGRVFGFTDWLYGSPAAGTVAPPSPTPTPVATPRPSATAAPTAAPTTAPTPSPTTAPTTAPTPASTPTSAPETRIRSAESAGARVVDATSTSASATSIDVATPSGAKPGDLLVAAIEVRGRPAITAPAGWQRVRLDANGNIVELATYIRVVSGDEPASHSWTFDRSSAAVAVIALVRGAASDPIGDATGRINAKSTSIVASSAVADRDGSLVLAFFGIARATSIAPPGGMTEIVEDATSTGRYKATLELVAGSADRGGFGGLVATAGGSSASVAQVLVIRP